MVVRYLKILFVVFVALLCLLYSLQNLVNLEACYGAFAYVLGGVDHAAYPTTLVPKLGAPALIWLALTIVVGLEFIGGVVAAKGAWDLWSNRSGSAAAFNGAKTYALLGCGIGIVIWMGLFCVFGGALYAMWQTDVGRGSLENAYQFFGSCALVFLIVNSADGEV